VAATTPSLTLYTAERCPYAARARITLAEKALPYERVEIDLGNRPAFMFEKNPTGTVPVLEHEDGFVLPESRAIMEYLDERFPEPALLPGDARERALVRVALDRFERFSNAYYGWRNRNEPAERLDEQLRVLDAAAADGPFLVGGLDELSQRPSIAAEIATVAALPTSAAESADLSPWSVAAEAGRPASTA
jgi:glutathione S-transferase